MDEEKLLDSIEEGELDEYLDEIIRAANKRVRAAYEEKPKCPKCGHPWDEHDQEINLSQGLIKYPDITTLYECIHYAGMGDWCGCQERSRQPLDYNTGVE